MVRFRIALVRPSSRSRLPSSILERARPHFLLPLHNDLGFPWASGVILDGPLGIFRVSVVYLLHSVVMDPRGSA